MLNLSAGFVALVLLLSLILWGLTFIVMTGLMASFDEKVFWKRYELNKKETRNVE